MAEARLVKDLLGDLPAVWVDKTKWVAAVFKGLSSDEELYFGRSSEAMSPIDLMARAVSGLMLLEKRSLSYRPGDFVFWIGPCATCGSLSFLRILHASQAGYLIQKIKELRNPLGRDAMSLAGRAWKHIQAASPWLHGDSWCPPQLCQKERNRLKCCMYIMAVAKCPHRAPNPTISREAARQNVCLLQLLLHSSANHFGKVNEWARDRLYFEVAHAWGVHHLDPRPAVRNSYIADAKITPIYLLSILTILKEDLGKRAPLSTDVQIKMIRGSVNVSEADLRANTSSIRMEGSLYTTADLATSDHLKTCPITHVERFSPTGPLEYISTLPRGPF